MSRYSRLILLANAIALGQGASGCDRPQIDGSPSPNSSTAFEAARDGIAVGFDRQAGVVVFDSVHAGKFRPLRTALPVLSFAGANADATGIAYTSLARVGVKGQGVSQRVGLDEALKLTLDDLVPTGQLVVERADGRTEAISPAHVFATAAAWHPSDPNLIAYGYADGDQYGIKLYDFSTGQDRDLVRGALTPDYVAWSDDGGAVGAYMADALLPAAQTAGENAGEPVRRWQSFDAFRAERIGSATFLNGSARFASDGSAFTLAFETGAVVKLHDAFGDQQAVIERLQGNLVSETFRADQVRYRSSRGLAFVNFDARTNGLWATDGSSLPQQIAVASAVTYKIPMHALENPMAFTQVGTGYGGAGCFIGGGGAFDHFNSMAYAVDMQLTADQNGYHGDEIIASASGTVSAWRSGETCTHAELSFTCPDYRASCPKGFGNWIIISHSDGKWTMYGHLEPTNFKVTHTGSVSSGCWIADEGHTGWVEGNKNQCGDHLHFQWQNGSTTGAQSLPGSFADAPALSSGSCARRFPTSGIMSCVL